MPGLAKPAFFGYTEHGSTRSAVKKGGTKMNMQENARLILGLRALMQECADKLGVTKTMVINKGVQLVKAELDKK